MDYERYQNLHTIVMLRDILRKWWRAELTFADKTGTVLEWSKGNIQPPPNDFCRLALFSKEGFRRCTSSVRVLHEKFKASKKVRRSQFHECHQGFTIVGARNRLTDAALAGRAPLVDEAEFDDAEPAPAVRSEALAASADQPAMASVTLPRAGDGVLGTERLRAELLSIRDLLSA